MAARRDRPLAAQAWLRAPASRRVLAALGADGHAARFVGGCVRDGLLGLPDVGRELDVATPERPDQVIRLLERAGLPAIPTGLAHGTVTTIADGRRFEITTLRRDVACDGRHAEVEFTDDFALDAARRDFTINAMSCDDAGRLYDYFGGRADLAAGRVRFVGDAAARIAEDYLRILRFFRFFAYYGRPPADAEALAACRAAAPELRRLSGERIQAEMVRLLEAAEPRARAAPDGRDRRARRGDPGAGRARAPGPADRAGARAAIPWSGSPPCCVRRPRMPAAARTVVDRWRMANRDAARLLALTAEPLPEPGRRAEASARAICTASAPSAMPIWSGSRRPMPRAIPAQRSPTRWPLPKAWQPKRLPVGGDDILALGVPAGPRVGALLAALEAWWVAHDFAPDRAACLAEARRLLALDSAGDGTAAQGGPNDSTRA